MSFKDLFYRDVSVIFQVTLHSVAGTKCGERQRKYLIFGFLATLIMKTAVSCEPMKHL